MTGLSLVLIFVLGLLHGCSSSGWRLKIKTSSSPSSDRA